MISLRISSVGLPNRFFWTCAVKAGIVVAGGAIMKIFDMLYDGRIYPAENVNPKTEKYCQLDEEFKKLLDELRDKLSDSDQLLLERIVTLSFNIVDEECRCMFAEGVRFGVGLMRELDELNQNSK